MKYLFSKVPGYAKLNNRLAVVLIPGRAIDDPAIPGLIFTGSIREIKSGPTPLPSALPAFINR
jgi:hypothetical protein